MFVRVIIALVLVTAIIPGTLMARNIVSNSGFEMGDVGGLPEEWSDQKERDAEGRVILTDKKPHGGEKCLFIEHTNDDGYIHPNKSVEIEAGDYTFSLWARSDKEIRFSAQIYRTTDWSTPLNGSCKLKNDEWTKFEFSFSALEAFSGSIQIGLTVPGRLWLDDVQIIRKSAVKQIANIQIRDKDDIVVENEYLTAAFVSKKGKVVIRSKSGEKKAEIMPLQLKGKAAIITSCEILSNTGEEAAVEAHFSAEGMAESLSVVFSFSKDRIIEIKPGNMEGVCFLSPIEYAIVPSFISDDLMFAVKDYPSMKTLNLPSENLFLGLLRGENSMLVLTWPKGKQEIRLALNDGGLFKSVDIENDGKSVYLAVLDAPGIWHREELKASHLEKDVPVDWKWPFPAKWITQFYEDGVKTAYPLAERSGIRVLDSGVKGIWRAGIGYFAYPFWFEGEKVFYHLSKKIPPKGESIIYFLERKGTPVLVSAPVDVIKQTLDDQTYRSILDSEGRRNRSLTRPNRTIGMATCGVTAKIKRVFEAGEEVEKKEYVKGGTEDMIYFLTKERERALEYQDFAHEMIDFLALNQKNKPELKPFLDTIESIAREIIAAYEHEKENIKDIKYARKLARETQALTHRKSPDNPEAFMKLSREWTGMGGAVDDLNRELHTLTRKLFQQAGNGCIGQREAVEMAEEIRRRTIKCLRRPGSYEIWSDY